MSKRTFVVTGKVHGRDVYAGDRVGFVTSNFDRAKRWQSFTAAEHAAQALANLTTAVWHVVDTERGT